MGLAEIFFLIFAGPQRTVKSLKLVFRTVWGDSQEPWAWPGGYLESVQGGQSAARQAIQGETCVFRVGRRQGTGDDSQGW